MAKTKKKPSLSWEDAPDIIGVEELSEILGVGLGKASSIFNNKGFPSLTGVEGLKADKDAARLYLQGFKIKENQKTAMDYLIFLELKKLNSNIEELRLNKVNE